MSKNLREGEIVRLICLAIDMEGSTLKWEKLTEDEVYEQKKQFWDLVDTTMSEFNCFGGAWLGDGKNFFFVGEDIEQLALMAFKASHHLLERVFAELYLSLGINVHLTLHFGSAFYNQDPGKITGRAVDLCGKMKEASSAGSIVISEDFYLLLPEKEQRKFVYLGTSKKVYIPLYIFPEESKQSVKPEVLFPADKDPFIFWDSWQKTFLRLYRQLDTIGILQFRTLVRPEVKEVFVEPNAIEKSIYLKEELQGEILYLEEQLKEKKEEERQRLQSRLDFLKRELSRADISEGAPAPITEIFSKYQRLIVLGEPGSGKTTLLKWLGLNWRNYLSIFKKELPSGRQLPVFVRLKAYGDEQERELKKGKRLSFREFLGKYLENQGFSGIQRLLDELLEKGLIFLLLDGIDELSLAEQVKSVLPEIEGFVHTFPKNRVVVTSRIVGYAPLNLGELEKDMGICTLVPFNQAQIKDFLKKYCVSFEKALCLSSEIKELTAIGERQAESLIIQIEDNPSLASLITNPLMLTILALINRQGISLPEHRVEFYFRCILTLLDIWHKDREGRNLTPKEKQVFLNLALWMQEKELYIVREKEVVRFFSENLEGEEEARELLKQLMDCRGILCERGTGWIGFLHRSLQDYLAVRAIYIKKETEEYAIQYRRHPQWRELIRLLTAHIAIENLQIEDADALVRTIGMLDKEDELEEKTKLALFTACWCIADDIGISKDTREEIAEGCMRAMRDYHFPALVEDFENLLCVIKDGYIKEFLKDALLGLLKDEDWRVREAAAFFLGKIVEDKEVKDALLGLLKDEDKWVRSKVASSLGKIVEDKEVKDALLGLLKDEDEWVRKAAASSLGKIVEDKEVKDALLGLLKEDKDSDVPSAAASSLGKIVEDKEIRDALLGLLKDENCRVREEAASSLGKIGEDKEVKDALLGLLKDENWWVRKAAASSLGKIVEDKEVRDALLGLLLKDEHEKVREVVINAIGRIAYQDKIFERLCRCLDDPLLLVRDAAFRAIARFAYIKDRRQT